MQIVGLREEEWDCAQIVGQFTDSGIGMGPTFQFPMQVLADQEQKTTKKKGKQKSEKHTKKTENKRVNKVKIKYKKLKIEE